MSDAGVRSAGCHPVHARAWKILNWIKQRCLDVPAPLRNVSALVLALGACAPQPGPGQVAINSAAPPWKSPAVFQNDNAICTSLANGNPTVFVDCMRQRGNREEVYGTGGAPVNIAQLSPSPTPGIVPDTRNAYSTQQTNQRAWYDQRYRTQMGDLSNGTQAYRSGDYSKALEDWLKVDEGPDAVTAFPEVNFNATDFNYWLQHDAAHEYVRDISLARCKIGELYQRGLGVPVDYAEAARWYTKAMNMKPWGDDCGGWLGFLYAYGAGVPRDQDKARSLWDRQWETKVFTQLMDHNMLPKKIEDVNAFDWKAAAAKMKSQDDAKAEAKWEATLHAMHDIANGPGARSAQPQSGSSQPDWLTCHALSSSSHFIAGTAGCPPW